MMWIRNLMLRESQNAELEEISEWVGLRYFLFKSEETDALRKYAFPDGPKTG